MSFQHQEIKLRRKCPFLTSCSKACSHLQVGQLLWAQDEATYLVPKLACSRKAVGFWDCCFLGQCLGQKMKAVIKSQSFTSLFFLLCAWGGGYLGRGVTRRRDTQVLHCRASVAASCCLQSSCS